MGWLGGWAGWVGGSGAGVWWRLGWFGWGGGSVVSWGGWGLDADGQGKSCKRFQEGSVWRSKNPQCSGAIFVWVLTYAEALFETIKAPTSVRLFTFGIFGYCDRGSLFRTGFRKQTVSMSIRLRDLGNFLTSRSLGQMGMSPTPYLFRTSVSQTSYNTGRVLLAMLKPP